MKAPALVPSKIFSLQKKLNVREKAEIDNISNKIREKNMESLDDCR